jgi:monofunctional biosynthetic peptidoglycan transglycosylase
MKRAYSLLKISFVVSGLILSVVLIAIVGVLVVLSTVPSTKDILGCFTTSMYHVELCPKNNQYVRISTLPSQLQWGVILSEDGAFYSHKGLDWFELRESMEKNIKTHSYSRGGSTITQQLVKNLYLTSDKSLLRKFKEVLLALDVEKKLKKSQILELYFNVVEFGPNLFGIKKASQYYFGKSPSALSVSESVFLSVFYQILNFLGLVKRRES